MQTPVSETTAQGLYLDLMKRCLCNAIYENDVNMNWGAEYLVDPTSGKYIFQKGTPITTQLRVEGKTWPSVAHTMIGMHRLNNIQFCIEDILKNDIPGDMIETGVWRGGATILMRAVLKAYGVTDRKVWVADSFEGLPPADQEKYPQDIPYDWLSKVNVLAISLEEVQRNFERYDLLDEQVVFLKGWFKDTLSQAPIAQLALLRLDGDLYESTMDVLNALYAKVSPGGYIVVDDYNALDACKAAIHDFRESNNIADPMIAIDGDSVYWQRSQ